MSDELQQHDLEYRILYAIVVAGKSAAFADQVMSKLHTLILGHNQIGWFQGIIAFDGMNQLGALIRRAGTGNYRKVEKAFRQIAKSGLDLRSCSIHQLESVHGIGPKTARFFALWTRPGVRVAALDVHILRWLRSIGHVNAPRSTPPKGGSYDKWERAFLREADRRGMTPRDLDFQIWQQGSGYTGEVQSK